VVEEQIGFLRTGLEEVKGDVAGVKGTVDNVEASVNAILQKLSFLDGKDAAKKELREQKIARDGLTVAKMGVLATLFSGLGAGLVEGLNWAFKHLFR
jgi:hypothetical protein